MAAERESLDLAQADPWSVPLDQIDLSQPSLYENNVFWPYFARLRAEQPVHYCPDSVHGPFWSVTKFQDIKTVDTSHEMFSSEGGITIGDRPPDFQAPNFISMDPPKHDQQRKAVQPVVAPRNLSRLEATIRERAAKILDSLPVGETFNWVDLVSIELTTQMLATLFDFPFEDRRKLTYWSDMATSSEALGGTTPENERRSALLECLEVFTALWHERKAKPPSEDIDLISMLAHGGDTEDMLARPMEYLGNLILLIVGGNDTTRNSISGGVLALNENPDEYQKLRDHPELIGNMVSEIVRWQTPLAHMRRIAMHDTELGGEQIRRGDKVIMWYVSGNRDEEAWDRPDDFLIDRPDARRHLSFGFGIHRCMGNRLAEMQLRVLWEEIQKRFDRIELVGEPVRTASCFVKGYTEMPVRLHPN